MSQSADLLRKYAAILEMDSTRPVKVLSNFGQVPVKDVFQYVKSGQWDLPTFNWWVEARESYDRKQRDYDSPV